MCFHWPRPTQHEAERVKSLVSDDSSDSEVLELVQWGCLAAAGPLTTEKLFPLVNMASWKIIHYKWRFK